MAARAEPTEPVFTTGSESMVWRHLVAALEPDDLVLANLRLTSEAKDHELDLVVLMPEVGIVVVEVKGGSVSVDDQGRSWQGAGELRRRIRPVEQAREGKYALRQYVERDPRWRGSSRTRVRWAHSVVTPYTVVHERFAMPDCPRWTIHGRADMADLASRLRAVARFGAPAGERPPGPEPRRRRAGRRDRPGSPPAHPGRGRRRRRAGGVADRLTQEQLTLLKVTRLLHRVEVRGGAGSGKTVLALT